jgi:Flagellar transcriptional activator (FlhC)
MHTRRIGCLLDRERDDLALRMIRHEGRTCTIRACTGLSDDRIRRLYKAYARLAPGASIRRRRGKSPRQPSYFVRNARAQYEASLLANTLGAFGLLSGAVRLQAGSVAYGRLFCDAYETHGQLLTHAGLNREISFEHAWFLVQLLERGSGLRRLRCRKCDGRYVRDPVRAPRRGCPLCAMKLRMTPAHARRRCAPAVSSSAGGSGS